MSVTLITGAASGLGWALSQGCHERGHALILVDRNRELLDRRVAELKAASGPSVIGLSGDITETGFQQEIFARVERSTGRLDLLINNAGITHRSRVQDTAPEVFEQVMAVDWQAPVRLACLALPHLRQSRGSIINIGSMASWMPVPGRAAYCSAKAALAQFFEVLRCEVEADGIHILNIYPSFLDTPIERNALDADGRPATHARSTTGRTRSATWMAEQILRAHEQGRPWLFGDGLSRFGSYLWRLWPSQYLRSVRRRFAEDIRG